MKMVRRIHLFVGLFLAPWMLVYALSTITMNHGKAISAGRRSSPHVLEFERSYMRTFPNLKPETAAEQILADLRMSGYHSVRIQPEGRLVITIHRLLIPRRITYNPGLKKLIVEKMTFHLTSFLERVHKRAGPGKGSFPERVWFRSVDVVSAAILLWLVTGLIMFLQIPAARVIGLTLFLSGMLAFLTLLLTI